MRTFTAGEMEEIREADRHIEDADRERRAEAKRRDYQKHRDDRLRKMREWREANPDYQRNYYLRRKGKKK